MPIAQISVALIEGLLTRDTSSSHCASLNKGNSGKELYYSVEPISSHIEYSKASSICNIVFQIASHKLFYTLERMLYGRGIRNVLTSFISQLSAAGTAYTVYRFICGISVLEFHPWSDRAGCVILASDHTIFYSLIGSVLMDSLALCLLLYKSVLHAKEIKKSGFQQGWRTSYSILRVRSQLQLYWNVPPSQCCIQNVLCTRLFFHMQTAHRHGVGPTTISKIPSDIHFADFGMEMRRRDGADSSGLRAEDATWTGFPVISNRTPCAELLVVPRKAEMTAEYTRHAVHLRKRETAGRARSQRVLVFDRAVV
ncbi:hypothetical protein SCHPADRAFT_887756 [Schizopora paradoxa]|uniref:Uncharacterized protein n=1 Tax=Schizopora paradoxa TaxID=27342 RepID=A0A0H2RWM9_9AGAM|nr:hypothetical protein SCHPADRAFT_887756 [Schizopora paradoxa]